MQTVAWHTILFMFSHPLSVFFIDSATGLVLGKRVSVRVFVHVCVRACVCEVVCMCARMCVCECNFDLMPQLGLSPAGAGVCALISETLTKWPL